MTSLCSVFQLLISQLHFGYQSINQSINQPTEQTKSYVNNGTSASYSVQNLATFDICLHADTEKCLGGKAGDFRS